MSKATVAGLASLVMWAVNKGLTLAGLPHLPPSIVTALVIAIGGLATYLAEVAPAKVGGKHWHALVSMLALVGAIGAQYAPPSETPPAVPAAVALVPALEPAPVEVLAPPDSPPGAEAPAAEVAP